MPETSRFAGIVITMYAEAGERHNMNNHEIHSVVAFESVKPYTLRLTFEDHTIQTINFLPMLRGELYGPLRDLAIFNRVKVDHESGTLVWPNGADFDPAALHDWETVGAAMIEMAKTWDEFDATSISNQKAEIRP